MGELEDDSDSGRAGRPDTWWECAPPAHGPAEAEGSGPGTEGAAGLGAAAVRETFAAAEGGGAGLAGRGGVGEAVRLAADLRTAGGMGDGKVRAAR
jgi:hypothetical protein